MKTTVQISENSNSTDKRELPSHAYIRQYFLLDVRMMLRTSRMRRLGLILPLIFIAMTYGICLSDIKSLDTIIMLFPLAAISSPSIHMGSCIFGMEANFFDGLWSRPGSVRKMLESKYLLYAIMNCICAVLLLPLAYYSDKLSVPDIASLLILTVGVINLTMFASCCKPVRMDMDSYPYYNKEEYGSYSWKIQMPAIIIMFVTALCHHWECMTDKTILALGIIGICIHPIIISHIAKRYETNRHSFFETYRKRPLWK